MMNASQTTSSQLRNPLLNFIGEGIWGFQASFVASATVLTILLQDFGASERLIGSITAIEGVLTSLPSVIGVYLFRSERTRKRGLLLWHAVAMVPFLFVSGALVSYSPHLSARVVRLGLLASFACFMASLGVIVGVWMDWLAHLYDIRIRGTVLGAGFFASATMGSAGGLIAGWILRSYPGRTTFAGFYYLAGVLALLSILCFCF
ncbi:MAG TPA: hypothetical protein PKH07_20725, partial [bacterium]|nr:hypothetical protein [bacterium]